MSPPALFWQCLTVCLRNARGSLGPHNKLCGKVGAGKADAGKKKAYSLPPFIGLFLK